MVFYCEKMPQTVPSNDFSSAGFDYSTDFIADSFDLSLLPSNLDSQVPGSYQNLQQIFSFYSEDSSLPMFPNTCIEKESDMLLKSEPTGEITCDLVLSIKKEPVTSPGMLHSPEPDTFSLSSYTSSPSPPFQQCPASPENATTDPLLQTFKQEATLNIQDIIDELRLAQKQCEKKRDVFPPVKRDAFPPVKKVEFESAVPQAVLEKDREAAGKQPAEDHRLLREVLKDTSFQKKYHLRPFDIADFGTAFQPERQRADVGIVEGAKIKTEVEELAKDNIFGVDLSQEGIGPVFSLALEQLKKDVHSTSTILGISRDPVQWSEEDVKCWVLWNLRQYNLPLSSADFFKMQGSELVTLSEEKFQEISSQSGSLLHAQLEIWKAVCLEDTHLDVSNLLYDSPASQSNSSSVEMTDEEDEEEEMVPIESLASPRAPGGGKMTGRGSGSHIHLWQFLKELLASPQLHCSCIRWLDRSKGVFKIEDSVKVARLWGMRKNRPAMNYDKLSRSIRQYYKKGIMKKTERSQRLVYQFCHPYSL